MNSLERIKRAVAFEAVDRVPVVPQIFGYAGIQNGVPLDRYVSDGEALADCQLKEWKKYGYDALFALMDVGVEAGAVGARLRYSADKYPVVETYPVPSPDDIPGLTPPDPLTDGRMPELLKAVEILRERTKERAAVIGTVLGPMTFAVQMMGAEAALYCAIDYPDLFSELLDIAVDTAIRFGTLQLKRGAHVPLIFEPSGSPEFIPPQFFREYDMPRIRQLSTAFKAGGAEAVWLHIAGDVRSILPYYGEAGIDIANFDYPVGPGDAAGAVPDLCLDGNIKSYSFVGASGAEITSNGKTLVDYFEGRGGFILSSGCEIPPESKPENVAALVAAARDQ